MKVIRIAEALDELDSVNAEIRHRSCIEGKGFTVGLVSFRARGQQDRKQIVHDDRDVVCQVLEGSGQLWIGEEVTELEPGILCHIPSGTPHDFRAGTAESLVLCYSLIRTRS